MQLRESIPDLSGATNWLHQEIKNEKLCQGIPVLIHFWSVSCDSCKRNIPLIQTLMDTHRGRLEVIAVHMPRSEKDKELEKVIQQTQKYNITHPIAMDDNDVLSKHFNVRTVPAYFLFDGSGKLRYKQSSGSGKLLKKRVERFVESATMQ
ncbi:TlpA family protein disulfide reductase [Oceanobacillus manasiensis]|uniref:TlpA family protein disulfide reductase n=1 Tax=Oceanobacillus manasiensis TaxID=586413 RepID=UPI0005AA71DF|nr:TlpA disulfide reductase family protein [Oceanobacillus manasiensis]